MPPAPRFEPQHRAFGHGRDVDSLASAGMASRMVLVGGVALHVGVAGHGGDVVCPLHRRTWLCAVLGEATRSHRLAITPGALRTARSRPLLGAGPHTMERAIADLEGIREAVGIDKWIAVGHSSGSDLAVRYAVERPDSVVGVVGIAGKGPHRDRTWSEAHEAGKGRAPLHRGDKRRLEMPEVHESLSDSFTDWMHRDDLSATARCRQCGLPPRSACARSTTVRRRAARLPRPPPRFPHVPNPTHPGSGPRLSQRLRRLKSHPIGTSMRRSGQRQECKRGELARPLKLLIATGSGATGCAWVRRCRGRVRARRRRASLRSPSHSRPHRFRR